MFVFPPTLSSPPPSPYTPSSSSTPRAFSSGSSSPPYVLPITALSLLALLRLGVAQRRAARELGDPAAAAEESRVGTEEESRELRRDSSRADGRLSEADPRSEMSFFGSERAEEDGGGVGDGRGSSFGGLERYPSLSMCYPDSDSDSSSPRGADFGFGGSGGSGSDWDSPENGVFRWDAEDVGEGLIEIALDSHGGEEENLIEIDISPPTARKYH
ncbi:hypothetical protein NL676_007895 [Syzygium grande]|nr:hypothetical protein NL676_007895 [Syzygium grande]